MFRFEAAMTQLSLILVTPYIHNPDAIANLARITSLYF
jgi:hypothetical protein